MKFDDLGLLITNEPEPGCYGDSCAETSRYGLIQLVLPRPFSSVDFSKFFTQAGVVRHPESPWGADDTSEDQKLPLFCYLDCVGSPLLREFKQHDLFWRLKTFTGLRLFTQALLFQLPYRWDDGKKSFQPTSDSSCDYLNFCAQVFYSYLQGRNNAFIHLALKMVPREIMRYKVEQYYSNDLKNNQWLIDLYKSAIDIAWDRR